MSLITPTGEPTYEIGPSAPHATSYGRASSGGICGCGSLAALRLPDAP